MKPSQLFQAAIAVASLSFAVCANAQPSGTIKLLVGFPAGGAPDTVARAYADQLRQVTGATVVVENKPGASGKIAIDSLLSAPSDGQTVALIPSSVLALVPQVVKAAKYETDRDFVTLGSVAEYGFGVAAGPASKAVDLEAYKAWAKAHPQQSGFATPGPGTPQHFLGAQLKSVIGVDLTHIPYKGGAAALTDVLGGNVPLLITTEQLLVPYEADGKMKTLFITSKQRNPQLPKVPTAKEVGLPQLESTDWFGIFAKVGTPKAKVDEWKAVTAKVAASPAYIESLRKMGYTVAAQQPADFHALLAAEKAMWVQRVKLSGFDAAN